MATGLNGLNDVLKKLNREVNAINGRTLSGFISAVILIRRDMDKTPPLIPLDTGNLRSSWFTDPKMIGKEPFIRFGFTAFYAWYVHEKLGASFQRPGAGAKFLEAALKRNHKKILDEIAKEVRI